LELAGPKIDAVKELLEDSGDQKVIIFSQFAQVINRLAIQLLREEYNLEFLTGATEHRSRTDYIKRFQEDSLCKVLLMTIGAGGTGITATAGSVIIFTDLTWSPAANAQAIGRMDRIGQTKPMTIYNIVSEGTIEEYVLKRLKAKEDLFNALINDIPEMSLMKEYVGETYVR
jgi:non-specific serine/threonine protein kinase